MPDNGMLHGLDNPQHLKNWLKASGREYIVFNAIDLVNALTWPDEIHLLQQIIAKYGHYRSQFSASRPRDDSQVTVAKTDALDLPEIVGAMRQLLAQANQIDPDWKFPEIK